MEKIRTFVPPVRGTHSENCCHFHPNEEAVTKCASCGKPICQDCADSYGVTDGEYAGKALCYDCCKKLVSENVRMLKRNRRKIVAMYILTIIGILLGVFLGVSLVAEGSMPGWGVVLFAFVGGCLWTFIKNAFLVFKNLLHNFSKGAWLGGIFIFFYECIKIVVLAVWQTLKKIFLYTKYLIQTSGFIRSDSRALIEMTDYMEYTRIKSENSDVDFSSETLRRNTYAQLVAETGEEGAQTRIRGMVATINENGEIIRSFVE